jgi:hypothetical protein
LLAFIIPLKPKSVSKNWEYDILLLERTLKSVCNQTNSNFIIYVICSDLPKVNFTHSKIYYIQYPPLFLFNGKFEDEDYVNKYYNSDYAAKAMDKNKKLMYGSDIAIKSGVAYLMALDSDDLVNKYIVEYVDKYHLHDFPGWRIQKGFLFEEGNYYLTVSNSIQKICGSTHILHKRLISIPDFNRNNLWDYNIFESHGYLYDRIRDYNNELLLDFPLRGVVYVAHWFNTTNITSNLSKLTIRNILKKIIRFKYLSKKVKKEFGIYKLPTLN